MQPRYRSDALRWRTRAWRRRVERRRWWHMLGPIESGDRPTGRSRPVINITSPWYQYNARVVLVSLPARDLVVCGKMRLAVELLGLLALTPTPTSALRARAAPVGRRGMLLSAAGIGSLGIHRPCGAEEPLPLVTKMDAFQLKASYNGLDGALQSWRIEVTQVQLGNEPASVVAVAGLSDSQLQHFAESGCRANVESFKKSKDVMLQNLFLARGAARYERDPNVALDYIEKARESAEQARADLEEIARLSELTLAKSNRSAVQTEASVTFTPREAPRVENRLTF